jgi:hypothetical protein
MARKIAAFIVAPMWHDFMVKALAKYAQPSDAFVAPAPEPDPESLSPILRGQWNVNPAEGTHDILYWVDRNNPRSGGRGSPSDSQYPYWEYPVQLWAQTNGTYTGIPGVDTTGGTAGTPVTGSTGFTITSPVSGGSVSWGPAFTASVSYPPTMQISQVTYYLNNSLAAVSSQAPFTAMLNPQGHGVETLRAVATTPSGNVEASVIFNVQ